jgi:hypothetical protein
MKVFNRQISLFRNKSVKTRNGIAEITIFGRKAKLYSLTHPDVKHVVDACAKRTSIIRPPDYAAIEVSAANETIYLLINALPALNNEVELSAQNLTDENWVPLHYYTLVYAGQCYVFYERIAAQLLEAAIRNLPPRISPLLVDPRWTH